MATPTHLWETSTGKKIPITMLDDDHLRTAYKLCWIVVYYYQVYTRKIKDGMITGVAQDEGGDDVAKILELYWGIRTPIETATKFSILFEEEIKRRGKKYQRPKKDKLNEYLKAREVSRDYMYNSFKQAFSMTNLKS